MKIVPDAEQLSRWLRTHPGVEIACRDGSLTYRHGIADGAPGAVQVSDRIHLWQGLSRRVQEVAAAHRGCMPAALPTPEPAGPELPSTTTAPVQDTLSGVSVRLVITDAMWDRMSVRWTWWKAIL
ncbi:hypothetical protein [Streptomyces hundungensis]|uniref:hypothetical protein n=1 Tax=Streptomyces hundungensis TaxID=1077946 RepID=UPI003409B262